MLLLFFKNSKCSLESLFEYNARSGSPPSTALAIPYKFGQPKA